MTSNTVLHPKCTKHLHATRIAHTIFHRNHFIPPHSSDAKDTPLITAQDEFNSFTTKKRTETRTDNVLDAKSEATPEMMTDKPANIQPKVNTSKVDTETLVASSSKTTERKERKKGQKTQCVDSTKPMSANFEMDTSI